ncbi:hypothetical protein GOP47_0020295, partial [Adiantum capillus-veneris]
KRVALAWEGDTAGKEPPGHEDGEETNQGVGCREEACRKATGWQDRVRRGGLDCGAATLKPRAGASYRSAAGGACGMEEGRVALLQERHHGLHGKVKRPCE